jgi:predicted nucleic acid-binding protein
MIVLDASVALKWIFWDEAGGERARQYRDRHVSGDEIIAVPDLFFYEVANVLSNRTTLSVEAMSEAFSLLWSFDLDVFTLGLGEFLSGITLSERYRITLYDAAYIELARKLKCEFVTFDKKLYEKVKEPKLVKLL